MVEISKDDKAFLKTIEESTTKSGDHYVVPLPFKKENLIMLNKLLGGGPMNPNDAMP